jgi:shikimate kinase
MEGVMESVLLTPGELDAHVVQGTFRLSFVGMSNAGKSYRSKVLAREKDFLWYQVDEEIQKALEFADMAQISSWLGYPSDPTYAEREATYLELENQFTKQAALETKGKNLVFDTTGSVIHLEAETISILKENCLVIHLDVGEASLDKMVEKFFVEPKPVAWCGNFLQRSGESAQDALRRCYPALLLWRLGEYRKLAHITIPAEEMRDKNAAETLEIIKQHLIV